MRRPVEEFDGLRIVPCRRFADSRGSLLQAYTQSGLEALGIPSEFRQALQSRSCRHVVRGLHFQWEPPQGKLVRCVSGAILDIVVDIRKDSTTLGDHAAVGLTGANDLSLWVPPGFAHGFMSLADETVVYYECTAEWSPSTEGGILWCDPALGIEWPSADAILSERDRRMPTLAEWLADPRSARFRLTRP